MGAELPAIARAEFDVRLLSLLPEGQELLPGALTRLYVHYEELRRWNRRLSLVGPGTADEVLERHYGEALSALPLLPRGVATLVDVGSGAGFPGWVLAAARPEIDVTLVEPRERKWAFLKTACRRAALPCRCLDARVAVPLPEDLPARVDAVVMRAIAGVDEILEALAPRLAASAVALVWRGREPVRWPGDFVAERRVPLAGSQHRWIEVGTRRWPEDVERAR